MSSRWRRRAGVAVPRLVGVAAGLWLMGMPAVFDYAGTPAATSDRAVGPFVVWFSVVAAWEATRAVRLANLPVAAWLLAAPLVVDGHPAGAAAACVATGVVLAVTCVLGGSVAHRYGGGWIALWRPESAAKRLASPPPDPNQEMQT